MAAEPSPPVSDSEAAAGDAAAGAGPDMPPPGDDDRRERDDDRAAEIAAREALEDADQAASEQAQLNETARQDAERQALLDQVAAEHEAAVVAGEAYTLERDRQPAEEVVEAERQPVTGEGEDQGDSDPPPPPPPATAPSPAPYRAPEAEEPEDVEGGGYVDVPPAGTDDGSSVDSENSSSDVVQEGPSGPPPDTSNLPDETWTPSGAPTPPPFELSDPPPSEAPPDNSVV